MSLVRRRQLLLVAVALQAARLVHAQQPKRLLRVAVLSPNAKADPEVQAHFSAMAKRLQELGWKDGSNVRLEYRFAEADATRISGLAKELVGLRPDVFVASGIQPANAIRQQTLSIPIVFVQVSDPVAAGLITNLARPEGNITGFSNFEHSIGAKWLQTLKECAPNVRRVAVVFESANPTWMSYLRAIEASAPKFGFELTPIGMQGAEVKQEIGQFGKSPNGALVVLPSAVTRIHRELIISLAARYSLPAIYPYSFFATEGGLMSYGVDLLEEFRRTASYVDRILRGAKPAELPVQLPSKYELVINLKTARALGLTIPQVVLMRADQVIR